LATFVFRTAPSELAGNQKFDAVGMLTCYLFLLVAIPSSLVFTPLGAAGGPATIFAVALMIAYLAMQYHPDSVLDTAQKPIRVAGVIFFCSILAAYVAADRHYLSQLQQNAADRGIVSAVGWLAILMVSADGIDRPDRLKTLLNRIATAAAGLAAIGIVQFVTRLNVTKYIIIPGLTLNRAPTDLLIRNGFNRPFGTTAQPLEFAAVIVMVLPIAIHQARFAPPALRLRRWLKVAIIGAVIPMTVSRTALLGLAVVAAVLLPTWPRSYRRRAYAVVLACVAALLIVVPQLVGTFGNLITQIASGSASTDSRVTGISEALPYISQHPWFGSGFRTFLPQTYFYTDDQYLNSLITTGAVGLSCLAMLFLTGWSVARSLRRTSRDAEVRDLAQCLAAAVAVAAACFGTFDVLSFVIAGGLTFLILGCVGAAERLL
jgi:hypothetical protein